MDKNKTNIFIIILKLILFLFLFFVGIESIKESVLSFKVNYDLENLLKLKNLTEINYLMIGWLGTMIFTSGSSMANLIIGISPTGLLNTTSSVITVLGSRIGPDTVILMVGIANALKNKSISKGLFIPIIEFFITFIVCFTTFIFLPLTLALNISEENFKFPIQESDLFFDITGPLVEILLYNTNHFIVFIIGGFTFFMALKLFDQIFENDLPEINPKKNIKHNIIENFEDFLKTRDFSYLLYNPLLSFFLGIIITLITMSASVSVSLLIPLYIKGKLPLKVIITYILGSNIGTFGDTLFITFLTHESLLIKSMSLTIMSTILVTFTMVIFIDVLEYIGKFIENLNKKLFGIIISLLIMICPPLIILLLSL